MPNDRIGSNYILKLNYNTLPTGYRVTSENPRVIRITRGKLSKLNFAAANLRRVTLALNEESFEPGKLKLKEESLRDFVRIMPLLAEERSVLELYYTDRDRLKAVKSLIQKAWKAKRRPHPLDIEIVEKR